MNQFETLLKAVSKANVDFILIGGVAAYAYGASRLTLDIDFLYRRDPANYAKIVTALSPLEPSLRGAPPGLPFQLDEQTLAFGGNFTLNTTAGPVDLLATIAGGDYESLLAESTPTEVFDVSCRVLDLPALIRVKRAAGRPKDFEAIAELELIAEELERGDGTV